MNFGMVSDEEKTEYGKIDLIELGWRFDTALHISFLTIACVKISLNPK